MVAALTAVALALASAVPAKSRLVVLDLKGRGVSADLTASINDALLATVRGKAKDYDVLGMSEVAALLDLEKQKTKLACDTKEASCLTEIGGALGAERLVVATLDSVGTSYFFDLKLLDVRHARVMGDNSATLPHDDDKLLKAVATVAAQVFAPPPAPAPTAPPSTPVAAASTAAPAPTPAPAPAPAANAAPPPAAAPATAVPPANTTPIDSWNTRFPDAARDLGAWVKVHPVAAGVLFGYEGRATKELVTWAIEHPQGKLDAFVVAHPDWKMSELLVKRNPSEAFLGWARAHPKAAGDLVSHPHGLRWAGNHLYPGEWQAKE